MSLSSQNGSTTAAPLPNPPRRGEGTREKPSLAASPHGRGDGTRARDALLLACTVFPLIVFALPGVAVYDGERLFLTVFPLWAIFVGRGMQRFSAWIIEKASSQFTAAVVYYVLFSYHIGWQRSVHPSYLCYYNELTLGLAGAEGLGLEMDYWGSGVTRRLLTDLTEAIGTDSRVAVTPTLHQFQADEYRRQSPVLRRRRMQTVAFDPLVSAIDPVIVFRRRADMPDRGDGPLANHVVAITTLSDDDERLIWLAYATQPDGIPLNRPFSREDFRYP